MKIENHKEEVPFAHYEQRFRDLDPMKAVSRVKAVAWHQNEFYLTLLGRTFAIAHPAYAIRSLDGGPVPPLPVQTFLLRYLMECPPTALGGGWKTFRELPWGETYAGPYAGRVLTRAAFAFGTRIDKFRAACERMGAKKVSHGDAGYQFCLIGNFHMQILVWEGDEEFSPNVQILYSDNFTAFSAEDRVVAGDLLITAVKNFM